MPYFVWQGVGLDGRLKKGKTFARSEKELDVYLFHRDIALLRVRSTRTVYAFMPVPFFYKRYFFQQLAYLLDAGVLLPDALTILADQISNARFQTIVYAITDQVHAGATLHDALRAYPKLFEPLVSKIILVGQEAGNLSLALRALVHYMITRETFHKRLRSALTVPCITAAVFVLIVGVIIIGIVPMFAGLFTSLGKDVPAETRTLMQIRAYLTGWQGIATAAAVVLGVLGLGYYRATTHGRARWDAFTVKLPYVGRIIKQSALAHFLYAVSLLVDGGMALVPALTIAKNVVSNRYIRHELEVLEREVTHGQSLSDAMVHLDQQLFGPDIVALVTIGQESGNLGRLLDKAAGLYREHAERSITFITTVIQPLLIIVLGLLVALLTLIVYVPLFNLAHIV